MSRQLEIAEAMLKTFGNDRPADVAAACWIVANHVASIGALQPEAEKFGAYWHNPGDQPRTKKGKLK